MLTRSAPQVIQALKTTLAQLDANLSEENAQALSELRLILIRRIADLEAEEAAAALSPSADQSFPAEQSSVVPALLEEEETPPQPDPAAN